MSVPRKPRFEKLVHEFANHATAEFGPGDVLRAVRPAARSLPPRPKAMITSLLYGHSDLIEVEDGAWPSRRDVRWLPRAALFDQAVFRIQPQADEIRDGILVPGHRFLAVRHPAIAPYCCRLRLPDGGEAKTVTVTRPLAELARYCNLLSGEDLLSCLSPRVDRRLAALPRLRLLRSKADIAATVFDLRALYETLGFRVGDSFLVTVEDWGTGRFHLAHLPAAELGRLAVQDRAIVKEFEAALCRLHPDFGPFQGVEEQIAMAYLCAARRVLAAPGLHLDGFLEQTRKVELVTDEGGCFLAAVRAGRRRGPVLGLARLMGRWPEPCACLDSLLRFAGLECGEAYVTACLCDALYHGAPDLDQALARWLGRPGSSVFSRVAERRAFQRLARELCEDVCDTYDRAADEPVAPLRERALRLIDSIRKHLQALDETADPYGRIRTSLGELLSGVEALVSWLGLERVAERPVAADAVARLGQALGREEEALPRVLAGEDEFAADEDDEDAEEELPPPEHAYELRIELMGIEPPVWRCLRVAGDMSLGDLHWVIQVAMGWEFDHAHEFVVDRESYGPVADGFEGLDEDEVTLDELNLRRGRKFMYTYDFGDDWRHLLRVEKVLPPTPEDLQTACFAGGRACPPEDCGGVGGYYRILEALANPDDPEFADLREWVGDEYDPARFDLEAVQQRLAKAFTTEAD